MIKTHNDLKNFLVYEKGLYLDSDKKNRFLEVVTHMPNYALWKYVKLLRITEYHYNNRQCKSIGRYWHSLLYLFYRNKKNRMGLRLGIEIWENSFDIGLKIHHAGNIVINGMSHIGKNCQLHGDNVIGNNGLTFDSPMIGDYVEIGAGASIIGNVDVCDNVIIGAGAVVVKSIDKPGIYVGIPSRFSKKME